MVAGGATGPELLEGSANYVEQKKIFQLFESLLQTLLIDKDRPDSLAATNPIQHLIDVLKRDDARGKDAPKVVVSGPPGAQARSARGGSTCACTPTSRSL